MNGDRLMKRRLSLATSNQCEDEFDGRGVTLASVPSGGADRV
jgi:hypothetical protein